MYSIGEFSRISGLSIKALRLYHERGILVPNRIDESSGYRYYDSANIERARIIKLLRDMEFGLTDIADILENVSDEASAIKFLEEKRAEILEKIRKQKDILTNQRLKIYLMEIFIVLLLGSHSSYTPTYWARYSTFYSK